MWRALVAALVVGLIGLEDAEAAKGGKKKGGGKKGKGGDKRELSMDAGTIRLGGQVTLDIANGGNVGVTLAPSGGYFVADNIEVLGDIDVSVVGGQTMWTIGAGGRYFIDLDSFWAYIGATAGYGEVSFGTYTDNAVIITGLPGIVYPLSKNVGLDLGGRVEVSSVTGSTTTSIQLGYLGVQAFFK